MHFYIIIRNNQKLNQLKINQMKHSKLITVIVSGAILFTACKKDGDGGYGGGHNNPPQVKSTVFSATGDVTTVLTNFRVQLGDPNNTTPNQTVGRREVNWEGIPSANVNNNTFPLDFFNLTDP